MKKRLWALLLVMVLAFTACDPTGGRSSTVGETSGTQSGTSQEGTVSGEESQDVGGPIDGMPGDDFVLPDVLPDPGTPYTHVSFGMGYTAYTGWTMNEMEEKVIITFAPMPNNTMTIYAPEYYGASKLEAEHVVEYLNDYFFVNLGGTCTINSVINTTMCGGASGFLVEVTMVIDDDIPPIYMTLWVWQGGRNIYICDYRADATTYAAYLPMAQALMDSTHYA